jgi:ubiquitin carboxyl-terminal hydrolase 34
MNSMMQQFFNTPTFRYSLLSVKDEQAPKLVNFEDELVDDNLLHQLIKMTGFLELSERQEYNPREFCFSFKD